jgi:choice-of-anchor B domain-containing protein
MQHRVLRFAALSATGAVGAPAPPAASAQVRARRLAVLVWLAVALPLVVGLWPASAVAQGNKPQRHAPCVHGSAAGFACHKVDLQYHFPMNEIGGGLEVGTGRGSDVWGWTDPETRREYVIAGRENGTAIVDITDPKRPVYLANLPTSAIDNRIWRDIKVYADHAFIVSESLQNGMQVLDLTRLRDIDRDDAPVTLTADAVYKQFETAHNIAINEDSGFAYAVGARNLDRSLSCAGGLHMIDISEPTSPSFAGCFAEHGYMHDTQCVIYRGPDARFHGREICFGSNPPGGGLAGPDFVSIADVTDKSAPVPLSRTPYAGNSFSHQGWLTEDQAFFLHGDEGDELDFGHPTRTLTWDVSDLTAPAVVGTFFSSAAATDHNLYVKNRYVFQSNYRAGLRVLDLRNVTAGNLREVAFFDVYPPNDEPGFGFGTWSNYPFFNSGVVAVHGYQGLWLVKPRLGQRRP